MISGGRITLETKANGDNEVHISVTGHRRRDFAGKPDQRSSIRSLLQKALETAPASALP
jgi:hypothetical protein